MDINSNLIECFDWDEGNKDKNSNKHNVSTFEIEEVFFQKPLIIKEAVILKKTGF